MLRDMWPKVQEGVLLRDGRALTDSNESERYHLALMPSSARSGVIVHP